MGSIAGGRECGLTLGKASLDAQANQSQAQTWKSLIASLPEAHILQTWQWSQVKAAYGWQPFFVLWRASDAGRVEVQIAADPLELTAQADRAESRVQAASLILLRHVSIGGFAPRLRIIYAPKGPMLDWDDAPLRRQVLDDLQRLAKGLGAIFIKIDPDVLLGSGVPGDPNAHETILGRAVQADLAARGWVESAEQIQFRNTVLVDLHGNEDALLARMKQKTRYNIRLAARKVCVCEPGARRIFPSYTGCTLKPRCATGLSSVRKIIMNVSGRPSCKPACSSP